MNELTDYFDLQVNGYAGVDFNSDGVTADELHRACAALEAGGVGGILATIITERVDVMCARLANLAALRERDELCGRIIRGFHIEGPFLNKTDGYRGAHAADAILAGDVDTMQRLFDAGGGLTRLVTLAPERDAGFRVTSMLAARGVRVSAGHTNASIDQLSGAIDAGLSMFTHVGNGCPMMMHRHDNIIQRALSLRDRLWLIFIPDGVHIEFFALRNYLRAADLERTIFVTDAISASRLGPGRFTLAGWNIVIGEDLVARSPDGSHFVGSTVTWPRIQDNNAKYIGLNTADLQKVAVENPRK